MIVNDDTDERMTTKSDIPKGARSVRQWGLHGADAEWLCLSVTIQGLEDFREASTFSP